METVSAVLFFAYLSALVETHSALVRLTGGILLHLTNTLHARCNIKDVPMKWSQKCLPVH